MMTDTRLSVIICAYTLDRWDQLVEAVLSVHAQTTPAHEVLVVIDHNDELLDLGRAVAHRHRHRVVPNSQRRGLAGARNTGVEAAWGDVVVFLDDDARADPALAGGDVEALRATPRSSASAGSSCRCGRTVRRLVPARVRLGGGLLLHRATGTNCGGAQPDRCQHVVPA